MDDSRPLMLGLVGESAAGKTTLARGVVRLLGRGGVTPLCLDDYHRYTRAELLARNLTAANPAANNLALMASHLAELRAGRQIVKPLYDHRSGTIRGPEAVAPSGLVLAYGLLTLTPPSSPELFDLTVYLDPDPELRRAWRLARDVSERGYSAEEVATRAPARERDAARFIQVQRPRADLVVRFRPNSGPNGSADLDAELVLRDRYASDQLCAELGAAAIPGLQCAYLTADEDGRSGHRIVLDAEIGATCAARAADIIWGHLPGIAPLELTLLGQVRNDAQQMCHAAALALVQLLIATQLLRRRGASGR